MQVGNKKISTSYSMVEGSEVDYLNNITVERDLGVYTDDELKFSQHIDNITSKANQILGLVRRSITFMDRTVLKTLYTALVRPHLEYANVVWHPLYKKQIKQLEAVRRRATRMLPGFSDLCYEERLRKLELPSLVYRRFRGDCIEVYKYLHDKYSIPSSSLFELDIRDGSVTRGHLLKLKKKACRTLVRSNFFSNRVTNAWNNLPAEIVMSKTVNEFKGKFDKHWSEFHYVSDPDVLYQLTMSKK